MTRIALALAALVAVALAACGGGDGLEVAVEVACQPVTSFTYPDTKVGQTSMTFFVAERRAPGADPGRLDFRIDGPDAGAFTVDEGSLSTCDDRPYLGDGDVCTVRVGFTATAARAHHATLHLGDTAIPLTGPGVAAGGLTARVRNLDVTSGGIGSFDFIETLVVNDGPAPVAITGITGVGDHLAFAVSGTCTGTLTPGGACTARLAAVQRSRPGCVAGAFSIATSAGPLSVPIASRFLPAVEIYVSGKGAGRVVSTPPGLDCANVPDDLGLYAGRCATIFLHDDAITLTAVADGGSHFNGWGAFEHFVQGDGDCTAAGGTCRIPTFTVDDSFDRGALSIVRVSSAFASPAAKAIDVTVAGDGRGVIGGAVECTSSCRGWIEPGATASLEASTGSRFGGWSGACVGTAETCDLGAVVNDRAVTVRFDRDEHEAATILRRAYPPLRAGALTDDGDVLIVSGGGVARLAVDGTVRWTTPLLAPTEAIPIGAEVATAGDAIYVLLGRDPATLVALDGAGAIRWRRDAGPVSRDFLTLGDSLTVLPGGAVAVVNLLADRVRVWTAAGDVAWTATVAGATSVGQAPDGTLVVSAPDPPHLQRFDAAGTELPSWSVAAWRDFLVGDASGRLALYGAAGLRRLDAAGATTLTVPLPADARAVGAGALANGEIVTVATISPALSQSVGVRIERFDGAGRTALVDKPVRSLDGRYLTALGVDCAGDRCAVFGHLGRDHREQYDWIEVFRVP